MTRYKIFASIAIAGALGLSGCAASNPNQGQKVSDVPEWFLNPPSGGGIYGAGTIQSKSLQLAKEQADMAGCKEIAAVLSQKMEGLTKQFLGQEGAVGSSEAVEDLKSANRSIVNTTLSGCANKKREVRMMPDGSYKIFSLQFLDPSSAVAAAKASRESHKALTQSKQSFDELDKLLARDLQQGGATGN